MGQRKINREMRQKRNNTLGLVGIIAVLIVIGTANVYSSTFVLDSASGTLFGYLWRQVMWFLVGLVAAALWLKFFYRYLRRFWYLVGLAALLPLCLVPVLGLEVNGARRWLGFGAFSYQPSEVAKFAAVIIMAAALAFLLEHGQKITLWQKPFYEPLFIDWGNRHHLKEDGFFVRGLRKALGRIPLPNLALWPAAILALLVVIQPDLGTGVVIFLTPMLLFICSGLHLSRRDCWTVGIALVLVVVAILGFGHGYQQDRIVAWWDPWGHSDTIGYQITQSLIAIGSGGLRGEGLGTGISKFNYLPEAHTDFAFAVIAQEGGMIGAVLVIVLFCLLLHFGARTAQQSGDIFSFFLAMGITISLCSQAFLNIAMVMDLIPVVGVPLPFISYGGSSLIINIIAASTLVRISYDNYRDAARRQAEGPQRPVWPLPRKFHWPR